MESTNTKPIKNKSKRHWFKCFNPNDVVDPPRKTKTTDPLLSYISLAEKQGIVLPTVFTSALTVAKGGGVDGSASHRKKIGKERSLRIRQALIDALNHTALGKKIINRSKTNKNKKTWGRSKVDKLGGEGGKQGTNSYTNSSSHFSPAFTPSTLSSSTCSSSSQGTQVWGLYSELNSNPSMNGIGVKQEVGESRKKYFGSNMGICLLFFISLLVLIFWGKFFAIVCTSIGFYVVPYCKRRYCNERDISEESSECKQKFNMEGQSKKKI